MGCGGTWCASKCVIGAADPLRKCQTVTWLDVRYPHIYIYAPLGHTLKSIGGKYSKSHGAYGIDFEFGECIDFAQKGGGES